MIIKIGNGSPVKGARLQDGHGNRMPEVADGKVELHFADLELPKDLMAKLRPFLGNLAGVAYEEIYELSILNALREAQHQATDAVET